MVPTPLAQTMADDFLLERDGPLDDLLARLAVLRGTAAGGWCVLLHGEPGVGKTSLLRRARERAGRDVTWLDGRCDALLSPPPLGPPDRPARSVAAGALGRGALRPARPGRARRHARPCCATRTTPAVLAIDDVHWADGATLDLLRYLGRRIEGTRALLVLAYRDEGLAARPPACAACSVQPAHRTLRALAR